MFRLSLIFLFFFASNIHADTYLQSGENQWVSDDMVFCGMTAPQEKRYKCTYDACLKSASIHHTSVHNCEFFDGYASQSDSVWAFSGSEAESSMESEIQSDSDVVDYKSRSITCL